MFTRIDEITRISRVMFVKRRVVERFSEWMPYSLMKCVWHRDVHQASVHSSHPSKQRYLKLKRNNVGNKKPQRPSASYLFTEDVLWQMS